MVIAFPVFKIGLLLVKQISKPIANYIKTQSKNHPKVKATFIKFAQSYHRLEIRLKRRQAEMQNPDDLIRPLDEAKAIDLAANFIGESVIFGMAVTVLLIETIRKRQDDAEKQQFLSDKFQEMNDKIKLLESKMSQLHPNEALAQPQTLQKEPTIDSSSFTERIKRMIYKE